jgi:hypothetical protein
LIDLYQYVGKRGAVKVSVKKTIIVMLLAWIGAGPANAREYTTVRMTTASLIHKNDMSGSRLAALKDAKERCIREVLCSDLLNQAECNENNEKLENLFWRDPEPYIARFFIENEEITEDWEKYQVTVTADLRSNAMRVALLENSIGNVFSVVQKPTVMILVRERFETRVSGTRTVEMILAKMLREKGFKVIEPEQKKLIDLRNRLYSESIGGKEAVLTADMGFKADYLIFGEAEVTSSGPLSGTDLKARYANLSLRIIESSTAQIIAAEEGRGKTKHIDELTGGNWALEYAADMVGKNVLTRFESILKDELMSGTIIVVDMHGLQSQSHAEEIESLLRQTESMVSVYRRFYFSGMGEFEVTFKGTAAVLATALKELKINGAPIYVVETLPRYLRVSCCGQKKVGVQHIPEIFKKYMEEKYARFDLERAREDDKELASTINELLQNRNISDEHKNQLFAAQKEIEEKQKEAFYREKELAKRTEELEKATAFNKELEAKYLRSVKEMEGKIESVEGGQERKKIELNGLKAEKKELEERYTNLMNVLEKNTRKSSGEHDKEKGNYEKLFKEARDQFDNLRREMTNASNAIYSASQNQSNAVANKASSIFEYVEAVGKGVDLAKQISNFISGIK